MLDTVQLHAQMNICDIKLEGILVLSALFGASYQNLLRVLDVERYGTSKIAQMIVSINKWRGMHNRY